MPPSWGQVPSYQSVCYDIPDNCKLHQQCCKKLSHTKIQNLCT